MKKEKEKRKGKKRYKSTVFALHFHWDRYVSVFHFSPPLVRNDKDHSQYTSTFSTEKDEWKENTVDASIFHRELLMPLRLNAPENLRHEWLAHYFTNTWILAIEISRRDLHRRGMERVPECLRRRDGEPSSFISLGQRT